MCYNISMEDSNEIDNIEITEKVVPYVRIYLSVGRENHDLLSIEEIMSLLSQESASPNEKIKEGQILITLVCPVQVKVMENPAKITPENTKTDKGGLPETKQTGIKQEEVTPYFDIQNGKITSLFSEPEIISAGDENQKTVKGSSSQREIYIVQQGDTVNGIAIKFNLTEAKLRQLNKLAEGEVVLPRQRIFLN